MLRVLDACATGALVRTGNLDPVKDPVNEHQMREAHTRPHATGEVNPCFLLSLLSWIAAVLFSSKFLTPLEHVCLQKLLSLAASSQVQVSMLQLFRFAFNVSHLKGLPW